jgi:uncharacterized protein YkwD
MRPTFCVLLTATACAVPAAPAAASTHDRFERAVLREVNAQRHVAGLAGFRASPALARAADGHSAAQVRAGRIGHQVPGGPPLSRRAGVRAAWIGEAIALAPTGPGAARAVVRAWMGSPGHRAILLAPRARRAGIGRRTGRLQGQRSVVVTLDAAS